ncbi:hypothetical protein ACVI1N_004559 [Sinorhizobium medicae]
MVQRIDALFDIEREINGQRAEVRKAARQDRTLPLVLDLEARMKAQRPKLSRNDDLAKAFDYLLNRWPAFTFFLDDGRVCLSNNAAERALRGIRWAGNPGYSPVWTAVASAPRPCTA